MDNIKLVFQQTIALLEQLSIRHQYMDFPSGAIMLDIWHKNRFYVIQFFGDYIGVSEITNENPGFDTIPDEKFYNDNDYKIRISQILESRIW